MTFNLKYIPCRCFSADHFIRIEQDVEYADEGLTVSILSSRNCNIWHRIRWALKHVFGSQDLIFADLIVDPEEFRAALRELEGDN